MEKILEAKSTDTVMSLFGSFDSNVKLIEREMGVRITNKDTQIKVIGDNCDKAAAVLSRLIDEIEIGEPLTEQNIRYAIFSVNEDIEYVPPAKGDYICITAKGKSVKCKTHGQKNYIQKIRDNTVVIAIGPAGTGKTYLAVAMAVDAFRRKEVSRIILTRPAVEAGEKLGFLPGDLQMKVDPYLRPLYDALGDMLGMENYQKYLERGVIEIAPLAYMRGRTLDDAFIILDEAQNTTPEQMKMFLTRMGEGSKMVVTGDVTQIDLDGKDSGLVHATDILEGVEGIGVCRLTAKDVVRHPLVMRIIRAYEKDSEKKAEQKTKRGSANDKTVKDSRKESSEG